MRFPDFENQDPDDGPIDDCEYLDKISWWIERYESGECNKSIERVALQNIYELIKLWEKYKK